MARVTGIGGFFVRARGPEALNRWYADHLGVIMHVQPSEPDAASVARDPGSPA